MSLKSVSRLAFGALAIVFAQGAGITPALALDPATTTRPAAVTSMPGAVRVGDATSDEEFRLGSQLYFQGRQAAAVSELNRAAERGHPGALYLLGRMYRNGEGVQPDNLKAFGFFSRVAEDHDDDPPDSPSSAFVASAFVALGGYYLTGIKDTPVKPDVDRAREIFTYAASQFGDADAQYNLGRIYLDGKGDDRNPKIAAKWLNSAAKKGQVEAQAALGQLLFNGDEEFPRRSVQGLMWLTVARANAKAPGLDWIAEAQEQAFSLASEQERRSAMAQAQTYIARGGR